MPVGRRIEAALEDALAFAAGPGHPPRLIEAMRHAVFPGGARVRPRLALAVAAACGDEAPRVSVAAAAAIELLHCASLTHDDLPCFDDADTRRGRPSVHAAVGEPIAVLAGDALIVLSFETLARSASASPARLARLVGIVGRGAGAPMGICAGQAWESEPAGTVDVDAYHQAKTGALFVAASMAGAVAAGADPEPWRALGEALGGAYQAADDLLDALAEAPEAGKPVRRDGALARPSLVARYGVDGAEARLRSHVTAAMDAVPPCAGAPMLREMVRAQALRLAPKNFATTAA
jgi:geranylgeranyl diphosphate synthase type II